MGQHVDFIPDHQGKKKCKCKSYVYSEHLFIFNTYSFSLFSALIYFIIYFQHLFIFIISSRGEHDAYDVVDSTGLKRIKWEIRPPLPRINDAPAQKADRTIFCNIEMEIGGGFMFSLQLSKIVAECRTCDSGKWPSSPKSLCSSVSAETENRRSWVLILSETRLCYLSDVPTNEHFIIIMFISSPNKLLSNTHIYA